MIRVQVLALAAILALLALACGQKPGVHTGAGGLTAGGGGLDGEDFGGDTGVEGLETTEGGGTTGGGGGGGTRGRTTTTTGGGGGRTGGGQTGGGQTGGGGPGDTTGVSDNEIIVGIHAPVTGAAPFPTQSFADGRDIYWTWSGAPEVHGRKVKILFEDDHYNPTTAVDRCRKMAEQQNAFLLVGGGGTDQIQACAQYAASKGIPYLSAGVTEIGLRNLPNYFAVSMSYRQQTELLWQMILKDSRLSPNQDKVAMVRTDTPNFDDAHQGFVDAAKKRNKTLVLDKTLPKNPSQTDYKQMAIDLQQADAQAVFILTAPLHYIQLGKELPPGYRPWFIGVGITMGLNTALESGCNLTGNAMNNGLFFSPFPNTDKIDGLDPDYNKAYQDRNGRQGDDLGIALWGLNKSLHRMFEKAGRNLSRQSFVQTMSQSGIETGVYPPVQYSQQDRFGADQVHLFKANCSEQRHITEKMFVSQF